MPAEPGKIPAPIRNIRELHAHLQTALEVEHSTIPPYLCALYSIKDGLNLEAAELIRSVVMEEMLHMILVANVLNAIDGKPNLTHAKFVPHYPAYLRHSNRAFVISLEKFSPTSVDTFLKIERPGKAGAPVERGEYATLGQFYQHIKKGLKDVCKANKYFNGKASKQITSEYYYGGGGDPIRVSNVDDACGALDVITDQGEGIRNSITDGDHQIFHQGKELAHYFRFKEIALGRYYTGKDTPKSGPTGTALPVDWNGVYNMRPNPKTGYYPQGTDLWVKSRQFCRAYRDLLARLEDGMNGQPERLIAAVAGMYDLKYKAVALMKTPCDDSGMTAGPSFEYVPPNE